MEVLSPFGHKLLFSKKHGYKNLFQDEKLGTKRSNLTSSFLKVGVE